MSIIKWIRFASLLYQQSCLLSHIWTCDRVVFSYTAVHHRVCRLYMYINTLRFYVSVCL